MNIRFFLPAVAFLASQALWAAAPAPFGVGDLSLTQDKTTLTITRDTMAQVQAKLPKGKKAPSATDGDGKPLEWDCFEWKTGYASFFRGGGLLERVQLSSSGTTSRGVGIGDSIDKVLAAYPKTSRFQEDKKIDYYQFEFEAGGYRMFLMFGYKRDTKKVAEIILATRGPVQDNQAAATQETTPEEPAPGQDSGSPASAAGIESLGYYDGFTWGSLTPAQKLAVATRLGQGIGQAANEAITDAQIQDVLDILETVYTAGDSEYFQLDPIRVFCTLAGIDEAMQDKIRAACQ